MSGQSGGRRKGERGFRGRVRRAARALPVAAALIAGAALAPGAAAAANLPWLYDGGLPTEASDTTLVLTVYNPTSSTQTVQYVGAFGSTTATIDAGAVGQPHDTACATAAACDETSTTFYASSPDLMPSATGVADEGTGPAPFLIPPGGFEVIGPDGTAFDAVNALATADAGGLSDVKTGEGALQALLGPIGGQLGTLQSSLTMIGGQVTNVGSTVSSLNATVTGGSTQSTTGGSSTSSLSAQVSALQTEVGQLSQQIATLTKDVTGKAKAKKHKKR